MAHRHPVASGFPRALFGTTLAVLLSMPVQGDPVAAQESEDGDSVVGLVLAPNLEETAVALAAAREVGGARWRGRSWASEAETRRGDDGSPAGGTGESDRGRVEAAAEAVRALYFEADFLRCLARLGDASASVEAALDEGRRDVASALAVYGGGCALGAGDEDLARRRLRWVASAELDPTPLGATAPELQALAEKVFAALRAGGDRVVPVRSEPAGARIIVDGRDAGLETPAEVTLPPGPHRLRLERLGRRPRNVPVGRDDGAEAGAPDPDLDRASQQALALDLALDPAPAELVREQLARRAARGEPLDDDAVLEASAEGFGARVVVLVATKGSRTMVAVFDRGLGRTVARASDADTPVAVRAAVSEWQGVVTPTPLRRDPWFWLTVVGSAAAVGVAVFLFTRPAEERFDVAVVP